MRFPLAFQVILSTPISTKAYRLVRELHEDQGLLETMGFANWNASARRSKIASLRAEDTQPSSCSVGLWLKPPLEDSLGIVKSWLKTIHREAPQQTDVSFLPSTALYF